MNCRRIQRLISAYVDGELPGTEMLTIRSHVNDCPDCRRELESLLLIKRSVSHLRMKQPSELLLSRIYGRLNNEQLEVQPSFAWKLRQHMSGISLTLRLAGVAAGLTAVAVVFNLGSGHQQSSYVYSPSTSLSVSSMMHNNELSGLLSNGARSNVADSGFTQPNIGVSYQVTPRSSDTSFASSESVWPYTPHN